MACSRKRQKQATLRPAGGRQAARPTQEGEHTRGERLACWRATNPLTPSPVRPPQAGSRASMHQHPPCSAARSASRTIGSSRLRPEPRLRGFFCAGGALSLPPAGPPTGSASAAAAASPSPASAALRLRPAAAAGSGAALARACCCSCCCWRLRLSSAGAAAAAAPASASAISTSRAPSSSSSSSSCPSASSPLCSSSESLPPDGEAEADAEALPPRCLPPAPAFLAAPPAFLPPAALPLGAQAPSPRYFQSCRGACLPGSASRQATPRHTAGRHARAAHAKSPPQLPPGPRVQAKEGAHTGPGHTCRLPHAWGSPCPHLALVRAAPDAVRVARHPGVGYSRLHAGELCSGKRKLGP